MQHLVHKLSLIYLVLTFPDLRSGLATLIAAINKIGAPFDARLVTDSQILRCYNGFAFSFDGTSHLHCFFARHIHFTSRNLYHQIRTSRAAGFTLNRIRKHVADNTSPIRLSAPLSFSWTYRRSESVSS